MTKTHLKRAVQAKVSPPQSEPLRSDQVANSAGGFSWAVDKWTHLRRFLVLGTAGGTYYISESDLTKDGLKTIEACLKEDYKRTVDEIVSISDAGRAAKNDYAVFALACAVALASSDDAKRYALDALPKVARIGTHLFQFVDALNDFGTLTGRAKRRALSNWYLDKSPDKLAYDVIKYRQREGWSHRDILRLAHPAGESSTASIFNWVTKGWESDNDFDNDPALEKIVGFELAQRSDSPEHTAKLVSEYGLPREALKTDHLSSPVVWEALLDSGMPLTAMIRNLGNMSRIGLLTQTSSATKTVVNALANEDAIRRARIHPLNVLFALKTYASGGGWRGRNNWTPVQKIVDALDGTFYKSFGFVEPTGKRILLALDVSGSMSHTIGDTNLSAREASAAMALVTANVEDACEIVGFTSRGWKSARAGIGRFGRYYEPSIEPLRISPRQRLDDVISYTARLPMGGTDCALPMLYAAENKLEFDAFVILTDSETWAGNVHPAKALEEYRKKFVSDARLVVVGMTSNGFSIADPKDAGQLDVVGFDSATPNIMSEFIAGRI